MFVKSKAFVASLGILGMALFGAACGDDDSNGGGGGGDFSSSVDSSAELGSLSQADKDTLCKDLGTYADGAFPNSAEKICTSLAIGFVPMSQPTTDEEAQQACAVGRDDCLAEGDVGNDDDCLEDVKPSCTATVDMYVKCTKAQIAQMKTVFNAIPACSEIDLAYLEQDNDGTGTSTEIAECEALRAACPDV